MTPALAPVRRRSAAPGSTAPALPDARRAARERRAAPGMDRALYRCDCGKAFHAEVTATVGCPRCGGGQPW